MAEQLTPDSFAPHVGDTFVASADSGDVELELSVLERLAAGGGPRAEPFSLEFLGPAQPSLGQRTYVLTHAHLGALEIFLVPIGPAPDGRMRYEAVFN